MILGSTTRERGDEEKDGGWWGDILWKSGRGWWWSCWVSRITGSWGWEGIFQENDEVESILEAADLWGEIPDTLWEAVARFKEVGILVGEPTSWLGEAGVIFKEGTRGSALLANIVVLFSYAAVLGICLGGEKVCLGGEKVCLGGEKEGLGSAKAKTSNLGRFLNKNIYIFDQILGNGVFIYIPSYPHSNLKGQTGYVW